ncbi:hypothetical protein [Paenarthrobacter sp. YIM B13468]|uniref:hypothetical protein n=1 Tax=Paenarthrobacter sp. YIM B13468 TaxID=3366295 RepID=UPI00366A9806
MVDRSVPATEEDLAPVARNASGGDWGMAAWDELPGHEVHILKDGRVIRTGYVEAVTVAADALWIAAEGVEARALYEKARGHVVLPISRPPVQILHYPVTGIPAFAWTTPRPVSCRCEY